MGVGGGWGVSPTHMHMHVYAHTHAHTCMRGKHGNDCPHWGNPWEFPMMSYMHVCMCIHVHVGGVHPLTTPNPHPPTPPPPGGTPGIIQNSIALELIKIFQFCLKI